MILPVWNRHSTSFGGEIAAVIVEPIAGNMNLLHLSLAS